MPSRRRAGRPANTTAASASHLICCRSSRPPARYRTASDTNAAARNATNATDSPLRVPTGTAAGPGQNLQRPAGSGTSARPRPARGGAPAVASRPPGQGQAGQQEAGCRDRAPAPRRQPPGREEEEHEREEERDGGEAAFGQRAHQLRRRERPGRSRSRSPRRRSQREKRQASALAEHEPADEVARAADDESAERGVGRRPPPQVPRIESRRWPPGRPARPRSGPPRRSRPAPVVTSIRCGAQRRPAWPSIPGSRATVFWLSVPAVMTQPFVIAGGGPMRTGSRRSPG